MVAAWGYGCTPQSTNEQPMNPTVEWAIAVHGGAGSISRSLMTDEQAAVYRSSLEGALMKGESMLMNNRSAVEVVTEVIALLEDDSLFNAGKGSVMTASGIHELDASIMSGHDRNAGAVTGLTSVRNPIRAAQLVMQESPHVFFSGAGAASFAAEYGLEHVDNAYFTTQKAKNALERSLNESVNKFGTVGCVVYDKTGNLAAGTSTGGMTAKRHGRIGDSPIIGAGTWADNATCAVSCTGHGEYFIRAGVAHEIAARMKHGNERLAEAARAVVMDELAQMGGTGGIIAVDALGNTAMVFNTGGMFRASANSAGERIVAVFGDE